MTTLLFDDFDTGVPPADIALAAACYHKLAEHYPGHNWRVNADHQQGIVAVQLGYFGATRREAPWGYRIKIDRLKGDPGLRAVVRAGGEMLERFGLPRAKAADDARSRAVEHGLILA